MSDFKGASIGHTYDEWPKWLLVQNGSELLRSHTTILSNNVGKEIFLASLATVFPLADSAYPRQHFLRADFPRRGELGFGQAIAEEDDFIADLVAGFERDEGGLHAAFDDLRAAAVDEAGARAEAVGVAGENDAVAARGE